MLGVFGLSTPFKKQLSFPQGMGIPHGDTSEDRNPGHAGGLHEAPEWPGLSKTRMTPWAALAFIWLASFCSAGPHDFC